MLVCVSSLSRKLPKDDSSYLWRKPEHVTKFYYLSTCNTCRKIEQEYDLPADTEKQDLKVKPLTAGEIDDLMQHAGSYEALFNRRSREYRGRNLHEQDLNEDDYKQLLGDHYSFVKRPILLHDGKAFIGNSKKVKTAAKEALTS